MNFNGVCDYINKKFPIRFKRTQKDAFAVYLSRLFTHCGYEEGDISIIKMNDSVENNNIIIGDLEKAEYIVTSHYDTPGKIGFLLAGAKYIGKALSWLVVFLLILALALTFVIVLTNNVPDLNYITKFLYCFGWLVALVVFGFVIPALCANKNNHNTSSGLFTVISMAEKIAADKELKDKVCFILFDNSEWGSLGASALVKWCKKKAYNLSNKKVICLEYLGNGEELTLCTSDKKNAVNLTLDELSSAFTEMDVQYSKLNSSTFFIGDNTQFKNSVMITKLSRSRLKTLYIPFLATNKDTVCDYDSLKELGAKLCNILAGKASADCE